MTTHWNEVADLANEKLIGVIATDNDIDFEDANELVAQVTASGRLVLPEISANWDRVFADAVDVVQSIIDDSGIIEHLANGGAVGNYQW